MKQVLLVGVLLDDRATRGAVQSAVRYAVQTHNDVTSIKSPSALYFKLDKYEKVVDATDEFQLSQESGRRHRRVSTQSSK